MKYRPNSLVLLSLFTCALLAVVAGACVRGLSQHEMEDYDGYLAPIYSPDGQYIYFVERSTTGKVKQTKAPSFFLDGGPKFDVFAAKDTFSVKRLHRQSGEVEELMHFAPSPIEGKSYESIETPFHVPEARLSFSKSGQLEFTVCLTIHQVPLAKTYTSSGVWVAAQHAAEISRSWVESHCEAGGYSEWQLFGDWELMEIQGELGYSPAAILAYNHITRDQKVIVKNKDYDRRYPHGVPLQKIVDNSRRSTIERAQAVNRNYEELMQKYRAMGMSEIEAGLRTGKDMQRLGYYPKSTTIVARRLAREEATKVNRNALFSIAKDEMESGIFHDIEKAVANPGEEIDRDFPPYPTHRDYSNSARLNAFLETGKTQFYVRYLGATYELTIKRP